MKVIKNDEVTEIVVEDPRLGTITWKPGPEILQRLNGFPYPGPEELSRVIAGSFKQLATLHAGSLQLNGEHLLYGMNRPAEVLVEVAQELTRIADNNSKGAN